MSKVSAAQVVTPVEALESPVASLIPVTPTGVDESVIVPLPSTPLTLEPQQLIVPPARNAHVCNAPAVICVAPLMPVTATGVDELVVVPSPS